MSNYLGIATVTAALQQLLRSAVSSKFPGATVSTLPPDQMIDSNSEAGINLFLFQSTVNTGYGNVDEPMRKSGGDLAQRPRFGVDLHYLITCLGKPERFEPEQMLALTLMTLHANAILYPEQLQDAARSAPAGALEDADLPLQTERIRLSPQRLSVEDMHRFWTIFNSTPYRLSVVYAASVVVLEGDVIPAVPPRPKAVLPAVKPDLPRSKEPSAHGRQAPKDREASQYQERTSISGKG